MTHSNETDWLDLIIYGKPRPNQEIQEIPLPEGYYVCMGCNEVSNYYKDYCGNCEAKAEMQGGV